MNTFLTVLTAGILTDNILLSKLLGFELLDNDISPLTITKRSGAITSFLILSTAVTYPLINWVLLPLGIDYLSTLCSIIIICGILFGAFKLAKKFCTPISVFFERNQKLLTCSTVLLGVCLLNFENEYVTGYFSALLYSLSVGIGFLLVSIIMSAIHERLKSSDLPKCIQGLPITLLTASLLSLAFGGLA
ncbi:MAG: hypothetical protein J6Q56_02775 [Clostridia bacterium]|nr:hypothetical protein [Clostridia bacterium]